MIQGPSDVIMGLSMGEDNQIGPGNILLSNFRLDDESVNLVRQETHQGVATYTACLADAVLSDAKGQAIHLTELNQRAKYNASLYSRIQKRGKFLHLPHPRRPLVMKIGLQMPVIKSYLKQIVQPVLECSDFC